MTNRAVAIPRGSQIVKCRWRATHVTRRDGVALQAQLAHVAAREHSRIGRAVRFVAGGTLLYSYGRMLEWKWAALIAVAFGTAYIVTAGDAYQRCRLAAVRLVTVDAMHRSLREFMSKRPLEARPHRRMASGTLRIAGTPDISRVNAMAAVAGDSVPRVG